MRAELVSMFSPIKTRLVKSLKRTREKGRGNRGSSPSKTTKYSRICRGMGEQGSGDMVPRLELLGAIWNSVEHFPSCLS